MTGFFGQKIAQNEPGSRLVKWPSLAAIALLRETYAAKVADHATAPVACLFLSSASRLGIEPHAALSILAAIADGARARKKLVTADLVDGVAKHQSVLEETLRAEVDQSGGD